MVRREVTGHWTIYQWCEVKKEEDLCVELTKVGKKVDPLLYTTSGSAPCIRLRSGEGQSGRTFVKGVLGGTRERGRWTTYLS